MIIDPACVSYQQKAYIIGAHDVRSRGRTLRCREKPGSHPNGERLSVRCGCSSECITSSHQDGGCCGLRRPLSVPAWFVFFPCRPSCPSSFLASCPASWSTRPSASFRRERGPAHETRPTLQDPWELSLIHISEPTRLLSISYAVF